MNLHPAHITHFTPDTPLSSHLLISLIPELIRVRSQVSGPRFPRVGGPWSMVHGLFGPSFCTSLHHFAPIPAKYCAVECRSGFQLATRQAWPRLGVWVGLEPEHEIGLKETGDGLATCRGL